jgi:hypothetical protein
MIPSCANYERLWRRTETGRGLTILEEAAIPTTTCSSEMSGDHII